MPTESSPVTVLPSAHANQLLLQQGIDLLGRLGSATFTRRVAGHSPVGAQFRHVLDHYEAFFRGLPSGRIDYDARARDPSIAMDPDRAAAAAMHWHGALADLGSTTGDAVLLVQTDSGAPARMPDWRTSSVGRELQFLASHTTHHFALMALLLELQGEPAPVDFGVAASTRAFVATHK
jgi:uncharacterized damage-inducible protein DinB